MLQKVFITSNNTATFVCPQCGNATTINVAKYANTRQAVTVKCRCICGERFDVSLEKRRQYRKATNLPGLYFYRMPNGEMDKGNMRVVDVSLNGFKLQLSVARNFTVGETLRIQFHLDDKRKTYLDKQVIVRSVQNTEVGTALSPSEREDSNLGFYLMN